MVLPGQRGMCHSDSAFRQTSNGYTMNHCTTGVVRMVLCVFLFEDHMVPRIAILWSCSLDRERGSFRESWREDLRVRAVIRDE